MSNYDEIKNKLKKFEKSPEGKNKTRYRTDAIVDPIPEPKPVNIFFKLLIIIILLTIIAAITFFLLKEETKPQPQADDVLIPEEPKEKVVPGLAEFNTAINYYKDSDVGNAVKYFNDALKLGYEEAKYYLGMLYFGYSMKDECQNNGHSYKNRQQSFTYLNDWLNNNPKYGDGLGEKYLGYMYMTGDGTTQNTEKGLEMYEKARKKAKYIGVYGACYGLGVVYYNGYGQASQDYKKALYYLEKDAREKGYEGANHLIARIYREGLGGVEKNEELANKYQKEYDERKKNNSYLPKVDFRENKEIKHRN